MAELEKAARENAAHLADTHEHDRMFHCSGGPPAAGFRPPAGIHHR
jgi:hypothetical protein